MRIMNLVQKDVRQLLRDWKTFGFLIIMPIGFTLLIGFVFSGGGQTEDARLPVGYLDQDGGAQLSAHLFELLADSDAIRPVEMEELGTEEIDRQVADAELAAAVVVPAGYTAQQLGGGTGVDLKPVVVADVASSAGQTAQNSVQAALARLAGAVRTAQLTAKAFEAAGGSADQGFLEAAVDRTLRAWEDPPLTISAKHSGATPEEAESATPTSDYAHSSAGVMVQFAMAGIIGAAEIMVLERKSGSLRRLLTTPMARLEIIAGHFLTMYLMILVQLLVLVLFGQLVLSVGYFREPVGAVLMILVTALWAASLGLLIGIFAKGEEQAIIFSLLIMLILSGLGGAWMPLEFTSQTFQTVGHLTPAAWAIDGFENLVVRGLGLESVLMPAGILLAFTVVFLGIGVWQFRTE
jgi:ABC-2 type transport system permease protein